MLYKKIEKREGEEIYEVTCDCGSIFNTLIFRITGKMECPTCHKKINKVDLYQQ